jgi:hypothetical protein
MAAEIDDERWEAIVERGKDRGLADGTFYANLLVYGSAAEFYGYLNADEYEREERYGCPEPLSGEWAGGSIREVLGLRSYAEVQPEILFDYEDAYRYGWDEGWWTVLAKWVRP